MGRKTIIYNNVGTAWSEIEVNGFPDNFFLTSVKAIIIDGSGTEVAIRISERPSSSAIEAGILEYDLVAELNYEEDYPLICYKVKDTDFGSLFISTKVDTGSDSKVKVILNYAI